jgi:O-antigen/teichoic acid export membrane protein
MGNRTLLSWFASILHKIIAATVGRFGRGTKAQATLFYGGSSLICQCLRFVGIVISTRLIAADQFGLLATAMAMIGFSGLIKEIGQNSAYMSCRAEERGFTSFHFAWSVLGGLAAAALLLILVNSVPGLIGLRPVLPWLALIVILEATAQTPLIISQKRFQFDRVAIVEISSVAVWMITVTIGAFLLRNLCGIIIARLAESFTRTVLLFFWYRKDLSFDQINPEVRRYYFRFARILGPLGWVEYFASNLDVLLLKTWVSDSELGVYDRTQHLMRVPLSLSVNFVDRVAGSSYSRAQQSATEIHRSIVQFATFMTVGVVVGLIAIQLFLWFFADLTLGRSWRDSVGDLWFWGIPLAILRPYVWNFNILFTNSGKPLHLLSSYLALTISTLVVGLILVPTLHAKGAYLTQAVAYLVVLAGLLRWFIHRGRCNDPAPVRAS